MDIEYIDNDADLLSSCQGLASSPVICIDTEFHRETTYYPQLALIQLSDAKRTLCIDPLAIDDFGPLLQLLTREDILKVLHASQQDLEIFNHLFGVLPKPVFDTQIAAGLLGLGEQIGYAALVKKMLDIDVDKSQSRTDWLKRPLTPQQLQYAASDVYYLAQVYPKIEQQLSRLDRLDWLQADFAELSQAASYEVDLETIWKKIKGNQKLKGVQLAILQALAAWREQQAKQRNRPRRRILPDEALIDLARLKPERVEKITQLRSLNKTRLKQEDAGQILKQLQSAQASPKENWPRHEKRHRLNAREEALIDALSALLRLKADEHRITPLNFASRKDLEKLLQGHTDIPLMHGWRYSHAGQWLQAFLQGKYSLQVQPGEASSTGNLAYQSTEVTA